MNPITSSIAHLETSSLFLSQSKDTIKTTLVQPGNTKLCVSKYCRVADSDLKIKR